jgi:HK97 gp10 family phage protein
MLNEDFNIVGGEQLQKFLNTFPVKLERRIVKRSLRPGASLISKEAKSRVQRKTGTLRKAIAVRSVKNRLAVEVYVRRGKGQKNDGWYAHILEGGAKPHVIRPWKDRKKVLSGGGVIYGKRIKHPGTVAKPFMKPALESKAQQAVHVVAERMTRLIEREVHR